MMKFTVPRAVIWAFVLSTCALLPPIWRLTAPLHLFCHVVFFVTGMTSTFLGGADRASVDDEVAYYFVVTNNGTTTLSDLVLTDSKVGDDSYDSTSQRKTVMAFLVW